MPRVLNKRIHGIPAGAVYVGRPSAFGNPFPMQTEAERGAVCEQFEHMLLNKPTLIAKVKAELKGKDLVCWCAPKRCHADTLLRIANED
jgi:hypothetical protein